MTHLLKSIGHMFNGLSNDSWLGKAAITGWAALTAYFSPIAGILLLCFACSVVDMYYGIKVTKKLHKKITSKRNWKGTLTKIKDEFVLILLAHLIEYTTFGSVLQCALSGGVAIIIALTELWSILENLNTLNPDGPWRSLGKFLKKKGEDYIGFEIDLEKDSDGKTIKVVAEES